MAIEKKKTLQTQLLLRFYYILITDTRLQWLRNTKKWCQWHKDQIQQINSSKEITYLLKLNISIQEFMYKMYPKKKKRRFNEKKKEEKKSSFSLKWGPGRKK